MAKTARCGKAVLRHLVSNELRMSILCGVLLYLIETDIPAVYVVHVMAMEKKWNFMRIILTTGLIIQKIGIELKTE